MKIKQKNNVGTLKKVLVYLKKYRFRMVLSVLLAFVSTASALYAPVLIGEAIDYITGPGTVNFEEIINRMIWVAVFICISALSNWVMNLINNRISFNTVRDIRQDAIDKLSRLPMKYFDGTQTGNIVNRIIADADTFADGLLLGFTQLFTGIITIVGTLLFLIRISGFIALIVVLITPVSLFVAAFIAKKTHRLFILQSTTRAEQTAYIDEIIGNEKLVKAYCREGASIEEFNEINDRLRECSLDATFYSSLVNPSTRFINAIVYAGAALAGASSIIGGRGSLTIGGLSIALSYASQYAKPFNEISGVVTELTGALACVSRIFDILEEEEETPDREGSVKLKKVKGSVEIENLSFSYVKEKPLIENFNLNVTPGMKVAIVGPTGCGKTTLINLLMRFYDADSGRIKIDGTDIYDMNRQDLRGCYGMVLQDTWLASGTIKENIAMARPDATMDEIIEAAKAAHAHGFITRLENGYDTFIAEGGGSLSQGQKQLLCIARLMLSLPPMLILDEATSSIDIRTEQKIQSAFMKLMEGRTSFVVAHRLSTIQNSDLIIVMKDGHIIETGNHEDLIVADGFYANLYYSQFKTD